MPKKALWMRILYLVVFFISLKPKFSEASLCSLILSRFSSKIASDVDQLFNVNRAEELVQKVEPIAKKLYQESSKPEKKKNKLIFEAYMKERLSYLPKEMQKKLQKVIDDKFVITAFKPSFLKREISGGAREVMGSIQLRVDIPDYLHETIFDFAVRVHELEHVIQIFTTGTGSADNYLFPRFAEDRHAVELGAMRSEGAFLLSFPKEVIASSLDTEFWKKSVNTSKLVQRFSSNAQKATTVGEYVQLNWDQNRYNLETLRKGQLTSYAIFPGMIPPFLTFAHIFNW